MRRQMGCVGGGSAVAVEAAQRQQGCSGMAMAVSVAAVLATQGQWQQRGGSRALFVGTQQQLSGRDERGGRAAEHLRQWLQQSGGSSGSTAMAVSV